MEPPSTTDWMTAWATIATAVATFGLVGVAWYQLGAISKNQKEWETLKACERYDSDPILDRVLCVLRDARNSGELFSAPVSKYSLEYRTVLNYFEGLATGVEQGFYIETIVRDHMSEIIQFHMSEGLEQLKLPRSPHDFTKIESLLATWSADKTYFQKRR